MNFIYSLHIFSIHGYITNSQVTSSQLVRALHRYRRGHGFDSRSGLNFFFQALFSQLLKLSKLLR